MAKNLGPNPDAFEVQKDFEKLKKELKEHKDKEKIDGFVPGNFGGSIREIDKK